MSQANIRTNACKLKANTLKMKYENGNANMKKNQIECKYELMNAN